MTQLLSFLVEYKGYFSIIFGGGHAISQQIINSRKKANIINIIVSKNLFILTELYKETDGVLYTIMKGL